MPPLFPPHPVRHDYGDDSVSIDASNISDGYVMIRYTGRSEKAKAQITIPDGTVYTYTIKGSDYNTFPLTGAMAITPSKSMNG